MPSGQRSDTAATLYASYLRDGGAALNASWALLALAGLTSTLAIVALCARLRRVDPTWAAWTAPVGVTGALLSAAHGVQEIARNAQLAHLWRDGDAATRAALTVSNSVPSVVDPRGLATSGFAGLFMLAAGALIARAGVPGSVALPRRLGQLALGGGALLLLLFVGSAFEIDLLVLLAGGLAALVVGPTWWIWLGLRLWRATQPVTEVGLSAGVATA